MTDMVTVEIQMSERVSYNATVQMTRTQFEQFDAALSKERGAALSRIEEQIADRVNRESDWHDADDIEIDTFRLVLEQHNEQSKPTAEGGSA